MKRYELPDTVRGITILSMILYHACWDLVYLGCIGEGFLTGTGAVIWQKSICCSFILLSGFCFSFGRYHVKRALTTLLFGVLITLITCLFMPDARDIFGVLYLLGLSPLMLLPVDRLYKRRSCPLPGVFFALSLLLFFLTMNVSGGYIGFYEQPLIKLPERLYRGYLMTLLGFIMPGFYSSDYFPVLPWSFLFFAGYFLHKLVSHCGSFEKLMSPSIPVFSLVGRHSLVIYMLHQPVIYGALSCLRLLRLL